MVSGAYLRQQAEILIAMSRATFDLGGGWAIAGNGVGTSHQGGLKELANFKRPVRIGT
jgi:hypothetical protein